LLRARIVSTGSYAPEKVLTNHDIEKIVDTSDEWISERSGIKERRIAGEGQAASDLAYYASQEALKAARLRPRDIDLILVATVSGDMPFPSTACILQDKLGAKNASAMDLNAVCSGFLYALAVGDSFIRSGSARRILVVGTEVISKFTNWEDRTTCVLFGDGAGAVMLESTEEDRGILSVELGSDGKLRDLLEIPGGGSLYPTSEKTIKDRMHYIRMKGNETFKVAVKTLEKTSLDILKKNKLKISDISLFIPHQANNRILQAVAKRLKVPMESMYLNLEKFGNTSAASIPIALDEAVRTRRVREDDYILMAAFGGGLTWASALVKW
jgi:3-oxoacyl-[acyl-carrier-protein] synthase-3